MQILLVYAVVWSLFCDMNVMWMTFFQRSCGNLNKLTFSDQIRNIKNNKLGKAYELIKAITVHNDIAYSFNQAYYLLYKAEDRKSVV